ncbi:hypothetical protein SAY87_003404 [Trapa incisa]|uniref:Major facilitator superfamily (MFS) profile domain-containing protein n=1 Tax=Trapa incisa TaxID=236973 RepID=A0AAN7KP53_9MYRT|nr:hypothetical protein SAY87_003404 [Trapa incisa]
MWISDVICILGWLLIGFAQKAWWLYCGRALLGCGISLLTYLVPVYISEITPKNLRGGFTALHEFVIGCSSSIAYVVGSLVNWRIFALLGLIPCLVQFFGLLFIPESPRWLIKTGHDLAFKASLSRLRGKNVDVSLEAAEIKDYTIYLEQVTQKSFLDMFQRKYLHCLIVGVGLMVFQQFGGMRGILFYTARIFESAGFPGQVGSIVAAATKITVGAVGVLLLSVYGRRPLLLVSAAGACLGALITGLSFLPHEGLLLKELCSVFFLIGVVVFIGGYELGLGSIPWIIMSEILPINIKGSAGSLSNLVSWIGSWVVTYSFDAIFEWSSAGIFFVYSCVCAAAVVFIARLVPETRGRTLEEIQVSITELEDNL